jgi:hypothetical protein
MMYVALGHYNFVTIQWFPFYTLFLLKTLRHPTLKTSLLAALFAALCLYAELTYSVFLLFLTLMLWLGTSPTWSYFWRRLGPLALIGGLTFLLTSPFVLAVLPDFLNPAFAEPGWGEGLKLSADLVGLFTLTPLHPLSGVDWVTELRAVIEGASRFSDANTLFLGYGIVGLALLGFFVNRRAGRVWLGSAFIFAILSLGPLLTINGQNRFDLDGLEVTFPLPFALLHYIPVINANRVPNRFGIPLTLALAVLVGYATFWLLSKINTLPRTTHPPKTATHSLHPLSSILYPLSLLLLTLLMFDQYSVPLSLTDARIPGVYEQIGAEPDDFTIMQLPLGWRNSYGTLGAEQTQLQYYQAAHTRPMLGGNTSRNPAFKFDYYRHIPLFQALTETELYRSVDEVTLERARTQAAELMTLYNIKYLVIQEPIKGRWPYVDTFLATRNLALDLIPHQPQPVYKSPGVQAFAVEPAPLPNPLRLDFGEWSSTPYRGEGWGDDETIFAATANWAIAPQATLFFPIAEPGDYTLGLQIAPFSYPGMPTQQLELQLNETFLEQSYSLHEGWQPIEVMLPPEQLREGLNRLTLHFTHVAQPRQVLPATKLIGQTGVETPLDLEVNSGQDFAFITVGFADSAVDASTHRRGVNVAVIDPHSGEVVAKRGFDTAANTFEAAALSEFISGLSAGQIVIVASQGAEAMAFLDSEALTALQLIGLSTETLRVPFAAIGVKGANPGTAAQAIGSNEATAYLRLGPLPDNRTLAAAVDIVTITRK